MKLTQTCEDLLESLQAALGAIEKSTPSPILENVLLVVEDNVGFWRGTDLELEIAAHSGLIESEPGQITLPARTLADICKTLPKQEPLVIQSLNNERATVLCGRSQFELACQAAAEFPDLTDIGETQQFEIKESDLKALIQKSAFAMANQDVRYYLNGLLIEFGPEFIRSVATDGHRLALCTQRDHALSIQTAQQIIVPRKGIMELQRLLSSDSSLPVLIQISHNHLRVKVDQLSLTTKLIEAKYPDYEAAIPKQSAIKIDLDREAFSKMLKSVAILSNEKFRGMRLTLESNTLRAQSINPKQETALVEMDVPYTGEAFNIGFNVSYLIEALDNLPHDVVTLQLNSADTSALLTDPKDDSVLNVVMPIRL